MKSLWRIPSLRLGRYLDVARACSPQRVRQLGSLSDAHHDDPPAERRSVEKALGDDHGETLGYRLKSGKRLPLPPLLDRKRQHPGKIYDTTKPRPDLKGRTAFQWDLYRNPYARALATRMRTDHPLEAHLPSFFQIDFKLVNHPTTQDPWLLPIPIVDKIPTERESLRKIRGAAGRTLSLKSWIKYISHEGGKYTNWHRIMYHANRYQLTPAAQKSVVWRQDMPDFIHAALRDVVFAKIKRIVHNPLLLRPLTHASPSAIAEIDNVGCLLFTRSFSNLAIRAVEERLATLTAFTDLLGDRLERYRVTRLKNASSSPQEYSRITQLAPLAPSPRFPWDVEQAPLHYPTTQYRGSRIPMYSLPDLLGDEKCVELLALHPSLADARCLVVLKKKETLKPRIWLLKLQGYLAEPLA